MVSLPRAVEWLRWSCIVGFGLNSSNACEACDFASGRWNGVSDASPCQSHHECESGEYQHTAPQQDSSLNGVSDRICSAHAACQNGTNRDANGTIIQAELETAAPSGSVDNGTLTDRVCEACPAGFVCDGSAAKTACAAGKFGDIIGSNECKDCPAGQHQDETTGTTSCKGAACVAGKFFEQVAQMERPQGGSYSLWRRRPDQPRSGTPFAEQFPQFAQGMDDGPAGRVDVARRSLARGELGRSRGRDAEEQQGALHGVESKRSGGRGNRAVTVNESKIQGFQRRQLTLTGSRIV